MTGTTPMPHRPQVRVAAIQPRGYPFNPAAAIDHLCATTAEAARQGAELVLFPEAFIGGYPWGLSFGTAVGGRKPAGRRTFGRYHDAAISVPGPETERIGRAAAAANAWVAVGVIERDAPRAPSSVPSSTSTRTEPWRGCTASSNPPPPNASSGERGTGARCR